MSRKKVKRKDRIPQEPRWLLRYLATGKCPVKGEKFHMTCEWEYAPDSVKCKQAWVKHHDLILSDWIARKPGTRPWGWWRFDAPRWERKFNAWIDSTLPDPRVQVSGKGVISWEKYPSIVPRFNFGIPEYWHEIDEDDPPTFESEAAYLKRHGFLTKSEEKRLKTADFEPKTICAFLTQ